MKTLTLFFTYGTSIADWDDNGSLDREINIYSKLLGYFDTIYLISYGVDDLRYAEMFPAGIVILPKAVDIPNALYSLCIPILYRHEIRKSDWLKTNQSLGSWSAVLAKILFRKRLLFRTGYTESLSFVRKNFLRKKVATLIERIAYSYADVSIVTSESQKDFVMERYQTRNIHVIPNGIDIKLFRPSDTRRITDDIRLLFIGRLHPEKNLLSILEAIQGLQVHLLIVGKGDLEPIIRKNRAEYGLNIDIIPRIPNAKLPETYRQADIYIQPSLYEGNPKTILEAMSCGLPVIGSDVVGIRNIITHKENGYLCETSPESIRQAINSLTGNPEIRRRLSNNARKYIEENYDIMHSMRAEQALYDSVAPYKP